MPVNPNDPKTSYQKINDKLQQLDEQKGTSHNPVKLEPPSRRSAVKVEVLACLGENCNQPQPVGQFQCLMSNNDVGVVIANEELIPFAIVVETTIDHPNLKIKSTIPSDSRIETLNDKTVRIKTTVETSQPRTPQKPNNFLDRVLKAFTLGGLGPKIEPSYEAYVLQTSDDSDNLTVSAKLTASIQDPDCVVHKSVLTLPPNTPLEEISDYVETQKRAVCRK